jgi:hypothetical protein
MLTVEQIAHREYLKSVTWQDIRQSVVDRDKNKCKQCGNKGYDVHHKHYKNWGNEKLEDLITLCRACHEQYHASQKGTRKSKAIGTRAIFGYLTKSKKIYLMNKFHLDETQLFQNIHAHPNPIICKEAARILGYNHWYGQPPTMSGRNLSKKQINQRKQMKTRKNKTSLYFKLNELNNFTS